MNDVMEFGLVGALFLGGLVLLATLIFLIALILAWSWNFVAPAFWAGAPHLTWVHAIAISVLLSFVRGLVADTINRK
jgi:hypothetical protein